MQEVEQDRSLVAAGLGAWDWDIGADRISWTRDASRLFGLEDARVESHEEFMNRIDLADRVRIDGLIAVAFEGNARAVLEFRATRSDGSLRWLRCIGRVFTNGQGRAVRMSGVIDDFTDQRPPARPAAARPKDAFTPGQVAQILGIAEASVKRLADAGAIACLRASPRARRFFTLQQVAGHLRGARPEPMQNLDQALRALDMKEAVAQVIDELSRGRKLEDVLDDAILPVAAAVPSSFMADLLKRLAALGGNGSLRGRPTLVARVGDSALEARMIECVLRGAGFEVLSAAESVTTGELAGMADRVGAKFAVFVLGRHPPDLLRSA